MTRFFLCLTVFLVGFVLSGFSQEKQEPKPLSKEPLQDSVDCYFNKGQYARAIPFAEKWVDKLKKEKRDKSAVYGAALNSLGRAFLFSGKYREAEPVFLEALDVLKKALGEENVEVANSIHSLGNVNMQMGRYPRAEEYFLRAMAIRKKVLGEDDLEVANSLHSLGSLYRYMGNYTQAEACFTSCLAMNKKALGDEHPEVADNLLGLGLITAHLGNYTKAEEHYLKALSIYKKTIGEEHPNVAGTFYNLASVYYQMGNFEKAEEFYLKALAIQTKTLGEEHPQVAFLLNNLARVFRQKGQLRKAEAYYLRALAIEKKALGEEHQEIGQALNDLGLLYYEMGNFQQAEEIESKALGILKKGLGNDHESLATAYNTLGNIYLSMGKFSEAEANLLKSYEIRRKKLGANHPHMENPLYSLASYYRQQNQGRLAESYYAMNWDNLVYQIQYSFPFLSDAEKAKFYDYSGRPIEAIKSFYLMSSLKAPAKTGEVYNQQLFTKALLLSTSARWKYRIKTSGNKKLLTLFTQWEITQNELSELFSETDSTLRSRLDSTLAKSEVLEKELSMRAEAYGKIADRKMATWKEVQAALKPGEAAIEMLRIPKWGINKVVTDTSDPEKPVYKIQGLTDTIYYAALIVKPGSVYPEMVLLKNGNDLEGKWLKFYQNAVKTKMQDDKSYKQFWEKIGAKLGSSIRIYFSPDGVFHNINMNTLFNPKTKKYLLEEKDIRLVTVTKDLINPEKSATQNKLASLVGFPSYYSEVATTTTSVTTEYRSSRNSPKISYGLRLESMGTLSELPATKDEVDKIAKILQTKGWDVKEYTGGDALEENIKETISPKVLHIATHGFFQPDTTPGSNPLLHSGLMLTGAGKTLKGEKSEDHEDGILTAYEAMNLNLDSTDLVVLSACETGLGKIKNGEGVYGLQRAFKVAGAKSIIMSLWKVNDEATQELMVSFYKNWLNTDVRLSPSKPSSTLRQAQGDKSTKRSAFLKAQKELKAKYPNPYYWGAFVMVGE